VKIYGERRGERTKVCGQIAKWSIFGGGVSVGVKRMWMAGAEKHKNGEQ